MGRRNTNRIILEDLEIIDAGAKGKSIARADDGRVVFVNNAVPGDIATIQTTKKRKAYFEGTAISFSKYSDKRVEPACSHFGTCGGCKWQFMGYEHQLFYKQKEVENNLRRIGKVDLPEISPILGAAEQYFYRNKMEFSFSDNKWLTLDQIQSDVVIADRNALGFHIPGMWDKILDLEKCHLQGDPSNAIRDFIKRKAIELEMSFFNTRKQEGVLRTLMIRTSSTGDVMVLLQFYDQEVICYNGSDHIFEEMEGLQFKINAKSFYQTNSQQAYELYKITRDFASLKGDEVVYDLYTGTGTIAQFIAKKAGKVIGVESVPEAIEAAKENAILNGIDNVSFYVGDMKKVFNEEFTNQHGMPDVVITDPPRDGMHGDVIEQLLRIAAPKIVYVSCNSATQGRDLALLDALYKITKVRAVDMFPQTFHVENVVLLEKR
jgi:23S rRNA (uracil1939-C5)-methyltransferase